MRPLRQCFIDLNTSPVSYTVVVFKKQKDFCKVRGLIFFLEVQQLDVVLTFTSRLILIFEEDTPRGISRLFRSPVGRS